jgi:hypothetical protein
VQNPLNDPPFLSNPADRAYGGSLAGGHIVVVAVSKQQINKQRHVEMELQRGILMGIGVAYLFGGSKQFTVVGTAR